MRLPLVTMTISLLTQPPSNLKLALVVCSCSLSTLKLQSIPTRLARSKSISSPYLVPIHTHIMSRASTPAQDERIPDENDTTEAPLTMAASVVLTNLPRDASQALATAGELPVQKSMNTTHFTYTPFQICYPLKCTHTHFPLSTSQLDTMFLAADF